MVLSKNWSLIRRSKRSIASRRSSGSTSRQTVSAAPWIAFWKLHDKLSTQRRTWCCFACRGQIELDGWLWCLCRPEAGQPSSAECNHSIFVKSFSIASTQLSLAWTSQDTEEPCCFCVQIQNVFLASGKASVPSGSSWSVSAASLRSTYRSTEQLNHHHGYRIGGKICAQHPPSLATSETSMWTA